MVALAVLAILTVALAAALAVGQRSNFQASPGGGMSTSKRVPRTFGATPLSATPIRRANSGS
jgi:hypothetical protein